MRNLYNRKKRINDKFNRSMCLNTSKYMCIVNDNLNLTYIKFINAS